MKKKKWKFVYKKIYNLAINKYYPLFLFGKI